MTRTAALSSFCRVFRSKNASPFLTTIDMFFDSKDDFDLIRKANEIKPGNLAKHLGVDASSILGIHTQEAALGIKITIVKKNGASGDPESTDVFGAQQYIPLLDLPIALP